MSGQVIRLTMSGVAAAVRKAIDDGTLQALNVALGDGSACEYETTIRGKTCVCAIGAALPPEFRTSPRLRQLCIETILCHAELPVTASPEDVTLLVDLQSAHDIWVEYRSKWGADSPGATNAGRDFMRQLEKLERASQ